jgi:hypothetical protein
MSDLVLMKNIGQLVTPRLAAFSALTAGGSGDNVLVKGVALDRTALGNALSCVVQVATRAVLAATATLSVGGCRLQHGNTPVDGDFVDFATVTVASLTGASGGSTETGLSLGEIDLTMARRYVRLVYTPDLSASGTDTAQVAALVVFAGQDRVASVGHATPVTAY